MRNNFKIHCIALCKNEADVIEVCLRDAIKWADYIYVYDNGSEDNTWQIVKNINHPRIIPWKQDAKPFNEGLRAEVFNTFRDRSTKGDWWLRLDADEFYPESPKTFFSRVPERHDFVWGTMVEYVVTEKDISTLDFSRPFEEIMGCLRYYYACWSEPRAFRYREGLIWNEDWAWPKHVGIVAKERIIYKHYPYRSPLQWQTRSKIRKKNMLAGLGGWNNKSENSRQMVKNSNDFLFDDGLSPLKVNEKDLPKHLEKNHVRFAKKIIHGLGIWP